MLTEVRIARETYVDSTLQDESALTLHFAYDTMGPVSVSYDGATYYYLRNAQGDVMGLVNTAGAQVVAYTYDAWGNLLTTTGTLAGTLGKDNPLRYRGYMYDEETGLYYLRSRYYNPGWGRFINADGYASTGQGMLGSNMFAYCLNNPVVCRDTNGTMAMRTNVVVMEDGAGSRSRPINGQELEPYNSMQYGNSTIGYSGCEAIACYNALICLGLEEPFERVMSHFTDRFTSKCLTYGWGRGGLWGGTPRDVASFLSQREISYTLICDEGDFTPITYNHTPGVFIVSYWNELRVLPVLSGYHTIAIDYNGTDFTAYNLYPGSPNAYSKTNVSDFLEGTGGLIVGFYIPYK